MRACSRERTIPGLVERAEVTARDPLAQGEPLRLGEGQGCPRPQTPRSEPSTTAQSSAGLGQQPQDRRRRGNWGCFLPGLGSELAEGVTTAINLPAAAGSESQPLGLMCLLAPPARAPGEVTASLGIRKPPAPHSKADPMATRSFSVPAPDLGLRFTLTSRAMQPWWPLVQTLSDPRISPLSCSFVVPHL